MPGNKQETYYSIPLKTLAVSTSAAAFGAFWSVAVFVFVLLACAFLDWVACVAWKPCASAKLGGCGRGRGAGLYATGRFVNSCEKFVVSVGWLMRGLMGGCCIFFSTSDHRRPWKNGCRSTCDASLSAPRRSFGSFVSSRVTKSRASGENQIGMGGSFCRMRLEENTS